MENTMKIALRQSRAAARTMHSAAIRVARRPLWGSLIPYWFLLPVVVVYLIFFVYPLLFSFYLSFMQWNLISPNKEFVGIANYRHLLQDEVFWIAFRNSGLYVLYTVPIAIFLGLGLALIVESMTKGKSLYRLMFFLPVVTSIGIISIVWSLMYNPDVGAVNKLLTMLGSVDPIG